MNKTELWRPAHVKLREKGKKRQKKEVKKRHFELAITKLIEFKFTYNNNCSFNSANEYNYFIAELIKQGDQPEWGELWLPPSNCHNPSQLYILKICGILLDTIIVVSPVLVKGS